MIAVLLPNCIQVLPPSILIIPILHSTLSSSSAQLQHNALSPPSTLGDCCNPVKMVMVLARYTVDEVRGLVSDAKARLVVTDEATIGKAVAACQGLQVDFVVNDGCR